MLGALCQSNRAVRWAAGPELVALLVAKRLVAPVFFRSSCLNTPPPARPLLQCYEETAGLCVGDVVTRTKKVSLHASPACMV